MAASLLRQSLALRQALLGAVVRSGQQSQVRLGSDAGPEPWNYLWQPGPYPKTEEERRAAAKKYGLIYEDYEPYPLEDWRHAGDYPMLKNSSADSRSGHINWDYPALKRNFGEPVHADFDWQQETRYDDTTRQRFNMAQRIGLVLLFIGTFAAPHYLMTKPFYLPITAAQKPCDGVHYTFEPAE